MKDEEFNRRIREIADLAVRQRDGAYTTEADAMFALELISRLALLLAQKRGDKLPNPKVDAP